MASDSPQAITVEGRRALEAQLRELIERRPALVARIAAARKEGDLKENAAYTQAREDQSALEGRVAELEAILRNAQLISQPTDSGVVQLGSRVTVRDEYGEADYHILGPLEADPSAGRISAQSPVGRALIGARRGESVTAVTPQGPRSLTVLRVG